ncbi:MAG TPA: FtsQ-type POTRA domain-containing protein [Gaiellaceae bacterium]
MGEKVLRLPRKRSIDVLRFAPSRRSLAISASIVLLAGGLYGLARGTSMFAVRSIEVDGASPALAGEIRAELRSFDGRSLVSLNANDVAQRVDGLATVRSSVVDRAFPHTLRIHVLPEVPVAVLRRGTESWLVSARGRVIATLPLRARHDLPRIWLPTRTQIATGAFLTNEPGALAAHSLAAFVGSGFSSRIAFVRALNGQITLGLRDGLEIKLGAPIDLRLKVAIARGILPLLAFPAAGGPDYLDITVPERPVAGRNPQPSG